MLGLAKLCHIPVWLLASTVASSSGGARIRGARHNLLICAALVKENIMPDTVRGPQSEMGVTNA